MGRRWARRWGTVALLAAVATTGGATAAHAADPSVSWDAASSTFEYGEYWQLSATAAAPESLGTWVVSGELGGVPSGYAASFSAYQSDPDTVVAYVSPSGTARPLNAGSYSATIALREMDGTGASYSPPAPATLIIAPAALTVTLQVVADPSNPSNAIIAGDLTGAFRDNFFTAGYPAGPLPPAGTWSISVTDESGDVVHEFTKDRGDTDDILGVSTYWPGVSAGTYTVRATFTTTGASSQNFAITQAAPVTYSALPAPGATSTATPAPPAPPPAAAAAGLTLPAWIPLVAGIVSAGLLALLVIQIVRLRRVGHPVAEQPQGGAA